MQGMGSGQGFWTLLSQDEQDTLRNLGLSRDYPVGDHLPRGRSGHHVFILLAGWVKILSATKDGHEIVLALRGDGDIVGEIGGETGHRNATIQAIGKVRALIVQYDKFRSFLDSQPGSRPRLSARRHAEMERRGRDSPHPRGDNRRRSDSPHSCSIWPNGTATW